MKIMICEVSGQGGFANYCNNLSQSLAQIEDMQISYFTTENNNIQNEKVNIQKCFKNYNSNIGKSNKVYWTINRIFVSTFNILLRNKRIYNEKYEVVNINQTIPVIDQYFIHKIKRTSKLIFTVHDVIPPVKSFYWSYKSLKKIYDKSDILIVHSEQNKRELKEKFNVSTNKIVVIPHGIEDDKSNLDTTIARKYLGLDLNKKYLLFFGGIRESKGLDILINALKGVDNCVLMITGSMPHGEKFNEYAELINKMGIETFEKVEYVLDEMIPYYYKASDIVVLPYKEFYSQSGVLMQAITYKKPVIATDVAGFKEMIFKYNIGKVCIPNNVDDLNKKIVEIITECDELKKYTQGLDRAAKNLSWNEVAKMHIRLYKNRGLNEHLKGV